MNGFSETAREHNSGTRGGPSKPWLLTRGNLDEFETAGEDNWSMFFNGADEQDVRMKTSRIVEYLIFPVYFPIGSPSPESVCYLIYGPLSMTDRVITNYSLGIK